MTTPRITSRIDTPAHGAAIVRYVLNEGRVTATGRSNVGRLVDFRVGSTDFHFTLHLDGRWRLNYISTYGNLQGVHGQATDASGYVVRGELAYRLASYLD